MVIICDICRFKNPGDPNFCGGCGVDMRESKVSENEKVRENTRKIPKKNPSSMMERKDENVIKWCAIKATCNSFSMTYPLFFSLVLSLAQGKAKLGFCGCNSCQQGYRELLAEFAHNEGRKNITASSREIVIKVRETDLKGLNIDISKFLKKLESSSSKQEDSPEKNSISTKRDSGKIVIEVDKAIIENTVLDVISSEAGRKVIKEIAIQKESARGEIRTHGSLRKRILSPPVFARLAYPRSDTIIWR